MMTTPSAQSLRADEKRCMSLTPPNTATATALVAAHGVVDSALADVRSRHAALDKQIRH